MTDHSKNNFEKKLVTIKFDDQNEQIIEMEFNEDLSKTESEFINAELSSFNKK